MNHSNFCFDPENYVYVCARFNKPCCCAIGLFLQNSAEGGGNLKDTAKHSPDVKATENRQQLDVALKYSKKNQGSSLLYGMRN